MTNNEPLLFPWLMDERYLTRAFVSYQIKLLDARLHQMMAPDWRDGTGLQNIPSMCLAQLIACCSDLIRQYDCFLHEMMSDEALELRQVPFVREHNVSDCYLLIQQIKQRFWLARSAAEEMAIASELLFFYKNLCSLLQELHDAHQTEPLDQHGFSAALTAILEAKNWQDWLKAIVALADDQGDNAARYKQQIEQLPDQELLGLYYLFDLPDYIMLANRLFLYKHDPSTLFEHSLHPEKLLSVQSRLNLLHAFIELLQQTVLQQLKQRGFNAEHDYLLHGNDVPPGILINDANRFREGILDALKVWGLKRLANADEPGAKSRLDEVFRAYKFWFNPNQLIDAAMALHVQLTGSGQTEAVNHTLFATQLSLIFRRLTTAQGMDLYGYFSNKATCYLMRSLLAAAEGQAITGLPLFDENERGTFKHAYLVLDSLMNGLRNELQQRHISTLPYCRELHRQVKPGRRIMLALKRILAIYPYATEEKNETLQRLFDELDDNN